MNQVLKSYNPANGDVVGEVPVTAIDAIDEIVSRAQEAGRRWAERTPGQRAELLKMAGEKLGEQSEDLGRLLSEEMGKPLRFGQGEVGYCASYIGPKAEEIADALAPVVTQSNGVRTTRYFDPLGVCAVISPWNYPMSMINWMVIPALMAGNAVVLKPSEETPLIAQAYVDVLNMFLPEGVLQVVHGDDAQGRALVESDVNMVVFTGSRSAGMNIMRASASGLKRLVLELGGKDPLIVLADADVEQSAAFAVENSFENAGQMCVSTERIYVHDSIADQFESRVAELAAELKTGPWDEEGVDIGPMIHSQQRDHVIAQIKDALDKGARVLCGGVDHPQRYVLPTVLADVQDDMDIMTEETFGPVACIARFSDADDVVRRANENPYALGASVFGADEEQAYAIARRLDSGMIGVNKSCFATPDSPWVGAKHSGYGYHGSAEGHHQFTQVRVVSTLKS